VSESIIVTVAVVAASVQLVAQDAAKPKTGEHER
jgi:hypothetical protein